MATTNNNATKVNAEVPVEQIDLTGTKVQTEETNENPEAINENSTPEIVISGDDFNKTVAMLIKAGCKKFSNIRVKNANLDDREDYIRVSLTLMNKVPGSVPVVDDLGKPTGEYKQGLTDVIYSSNFAIIGLMKNNADLGWLANKIKDRPGGIAPILVGSTISILQQFVPKDTEYINPFTTRENPQVKIYPHDVIIYHIVDIKLGKAGEKFVDKMMDKLVDAMYESNI